MKGYQFKTGRWSSHSLLLELFPNDGRGVRVLDVGGGEGYLARELSLRGYRVVCIAEPGTASPGLHRHAETIEADLNCTVPELEGQFDYLLFGDVLEHLTNPVRVLSKLAEHLSPRGKVIGSLPNSAHWYVRFNVLLGRFPQDDRGLFDRTHLHFFAWKNWLELFSRSGLRIESRHSTVIPFAFALNRGHDDWLVALLERGNRVLAGVAPGLFAFQFVVSASRQER